MTFDSPGLTHNIIRDVLRETEQGVVTYALTVEAFMTGIKVLDPV